MSRIKAIIFDWDGVIVDSVKAIYDVNQKILERLGGKTFNDMDDFRKRISNWRTLYQDIAPGNPHILEEAVKIFKQEFYKTLQNIGMFDGIEDVIHQLSNNYKLGIVSHNSREIIENKLKENNLLVFFSSIVDGSVENIKPHPEPINICLSELGAEPHEACMIGDMPDDITAAKNANVALIIGVSYGSSPISELVDANIIVNSPKEILKVLGGV